MNPRYPVYVISKGRSETCHTARLLVSHDVPFRLVVEPAEEEAYRREHPEAPIRVAPENFSARGDGSIPVRNWVWEDARAEGAERHWILDDNIDCVWRRYRARRIPCHAGTALRVAEDFVDRYENVAIAGLNYSMFAPDRVRLAPFFLNCHVYSTLLIRSDLPNRWRGRYNEDADLCLQVLADGWCTVLINAFLAHKRPTMTVRGGNEELYRGDGRLRMARSLERAWPGVVSVDRRFGRPQHVVRASWKRFDTPLRRRPDLDLQALPEKDDYGLRLREVREVRSPRLRALVEEQEP